MTFGRTPAESLRLKLLGHVDDLASWGSEYVRSLAGEIGREWAARTEERDAAAAAAAAAPSTGGGVGVTAAASKDGDAAATALALLLGLPPSFEQLLALVRQIVPFNVAHNAEVEAVDLLLETEQLSLLLEPGLGVDGGSFPRVCLYLLKCSDYLSTPEESAACCEVAFKLYLAHKQVRARGLVGGGGGGHN